MYVEHRLDLPMVQTWWDENLLNTEKFPKIKNVLAMAPNILLTCDIMAPSLIKETTEHESIFISIYYDFCFYSHTLYVIQIPAFCDEISPPPKKNTLISIMSSHRFAFHITTLNTCAGHGKLSSQNACRH